MPEGRDRGRDLRDEARVLAIMIFRKHTTDSTYIPCHSSVQPFCTPFPFSFICEGLNRQRSRQRGTERDRAFERLGLDRIGFCDDAVMI